MTSGAGRAARLVCGRRSKWVVLVLWVIVLVALGPLASKLMDAEKNDAASWLPGSAESTQVLDLQKKFVPQTAPAVVIFTRDGGLTAADVRQIQANTAAVRSLTAHGILGSRSVGPVPDRAQAPRAAQLIVPIVVGENGWNKLPDAVDDIRSAAERNLPGVAVHVTGPGGFGADQSKAFQGIDGTLLYSALAVVVVILLITYRSPTLLLVPVVSVVSALFTAQAVIYLLARHAGLTVNAQSAGILLVLVFGAGTDYGLLLVARYREELRRHEDRHEAMALALHRAGPAVIASAATVALSMLCLLAAEMNSTSGLGPVAAVGVAIALAAMVTLFPALLVIVGRWVFWPVIPHTGSAEPTATGVWARIGGRIARRPRAVWTATVAVLAALSFGLISLNAVGLSNAQGFTNTPESVVGQRLQDRYFPAGGGQPLVVISNAAQGPQVKRALTGLPGVVPASVGTPPGVAPVKDGLAYLEATLTDRPDSSAARRTVERARSELHAIPGADAKVGGGAAVLKDTAHASDEDNKLLIPLILAVVLIILGLLLRAVVAPLVLIATVVLSFAAALGVSALAFRHLFHWAGEDTAFPLFVFVFLVALGIDYNIFLMTRIREESWQRGTRQGVLVGLAATGGVITSAGLVLAGTFAALGTLPVVAFAEIGFAVAFGVLLDTFVVRSVLVSAISLDLRDRVWWPSRPPARPQEDEAARTRV
ncbi:MMPL family transporter [Actinacidiphila guanduensis]|jgi:RND superfamily putative drug exporter|uniref:Putative drug exporter of the RND superfamily n=1 Tax=Actinacidiphila guanduensis TaxID=310781 RepID=A0A1H0QEN2_9ACTN|nr:MMPL family transporter [Actinacidiphila guanduensis]SDP15148.1 putative drug exporter of the RND superfamily [Actinacidiphila guanduensis]